MTIALRHPLPLSLGRRRLVAAAVIIGVATAVDVWIATYKTLTPEGRAYLYGIPPYISQATLQRAWPHFFTSPSWAVPTALGIAALGLAAAAGVLRLRLAAVATVILGATLAGAVALYGHRVLDPHSPCQADALPRRYDCLYLVRPGWVAPTAFCIAVLGLAAATGVVVAARRRSA